ncbi:flagellar basal-body rod protein FlgF [Laribacter hongkongensis]|uniref:flagellar basal-body rod protein FlgF n=1 Tax=Laribacter hongkongensis TaxID=168471 RepID=UPI001EFD10FB|nr:flagellar basal-body rod protein FlgF [Laribacter hongkongensis]MCG9039970.1 flagellar basal-body rod protein FlgF [Laribacter hongkongensis]MCG9066639.1 flagellar basal-body rod protein FlgF [Laribacter hongkongensis]
MDKMLYIAMNGAKHVELQQQTTANNLANAHTPGFKAELNAFRALPVVGDGTPTRAYSVDHTTGHDESQGPMITTGNDQDFAVRGRGWFAVQDPQGNEAYTRAGGFVLDENGIMRTRDGRVIVGEGGPITVPPNSQVMIGEDGTVSAVQTDQIPRTVQVVDRIKLVGGEPRDLFKGEDGLFRRRDGQIAEADDGVRVATGMLEGSNVNPVDALTQMISHSRQFEFNVKLMQNADQNARRADQLLSITS